MRDSVIKAALDEPRVVEVDVSNLQVPSGSAWTAFTSARWHVSTWPDIPIILVCSDDQRRAAIKRNAIERYVPVYAHSPGDSELIVDTRRVRRRARAELPATLSSLRGSRQLISQWLHEWDRPEAGITAQTIATVFIDNVLRHTSSAPTLVLEAGPRTVAVAVSDSSHRPAVRHEHAESGAHTVSGLAIVAALSRAWGSHPRTDGKTVWALLGPENYL
ncbi:ATP-binding protein [Mycolicibacterium duvalii]|uniref:Sulfate transporter n=1 Tax=Mycolicibacterium duvalii TaxID=39688 RepID=A0A7I7JZ75_9MYCO|nr:ATP-binding protein [Mycolicibacterium duvalii]BBX16511.1 sulfate transporter [Mycolicibacterium duvalii]